MSTAARVFRNSGAVLAGQGLERLLKLVVIILLARYLQARGFGTYAFIFAYVELFAVITDLGVNAILVREVSRERERAGELLGSALLLKGLLTLAALGLCWGIIAALSYPGQIKLLVFVASAILILSFRVNSFRMTFDAVYQAELEMKYPMALGAMSEALSAVLILLAIAKGLGLGGIVLLQVAAYLPGFIALGVLFQRRVRPVYRVDLALWKRLLSLAFPIALANLFIMAYSRADLLMLSFMKGDESVGFYASALKLVGSLGIIPLALSTSLYPLIARYYLEDREKAARLFRYGMNSAIAIGLPISVLVTALARPIMLAIYGAPFGPAVPALQLLVWAVGMNFLLYILTTTFNAMDRQRVFMYYAMILTSLNVALNFLLIPRYDFLGACWATLLTEGALMVAGLLYLRPLVGPLPLKALLKYPLPAVAMGAVLWGLGVPYLVRVPVAIVVYAALLLIMGIVGREELGLLKEALRREARPSERAELSLG